MAHEINEGLEGKKKIRISAVEARDITDMSNKSSESSRRSRILEETERLIDVADSFIKKASSRGEDNTGLCLDYTDSETREDMRSCAYRVKSSLDERGYRTRITENPDLNTILVNIEW